MTDSTSIINSGDIINGFIYTVVGGLILSLLNYLAITIYGKYFSGNKNFFWKEKVSPLEKLINPKNQKQFKKRVKILLIDNEISLNIEQFNEEGYSLEYWPKVKSIKELQQGHFDIIVLDIKDVAKEYSEEDGFGVLKSIKQNNPSQIVIAFSAHSYALSKKKFWDLADDAVDKPVGFLEMKEVIDNLIQSKFNALNELTMLRQKLLSINIDRHQIYDIEKSIVYKMSKNKLLDIDHELKFISDSMQKNQIKNMIIRFINLYTNYDAE